jgi:hypothetical protein
MTLPQASVSIYEALRGDVIAGLARPEGLGAIVYHGLIRGLELLSRAPRSESTPIVTARSMQSVRSDPQFLHLLANMILQTHQEVAHVY